MIRKYSPADYKEVVDLLRLNTPLYFDPTEEVDLVRYLHTDATHYFVYEFCGRIVACGGINFGFDHGETARLSWDIVHPNKQGEGIGRQLAAYRIDRIRQNTDVRRICVRTTQMAAPFYEKIGFVLRCVKRDFWAKGFDLFEMYMQTSGVNEDEVSVINFNKDAE